MSILCKNEITKRAIRLISMPEMNQAYLPNDLTPYFGVFLVCNAEGRDDKTIIEFAEGILEKGAVFFSFWGTDCERVHDLFDEAIVQNDPDETDTSVRLTTWHTGESLDEALWSFLNVSFPADDYQEQCHTELMLVVDNDDWAAHLKMRIHEQLQLVKDVIGN
jgi:hypothetical protein